ncbi:hypothetical protein GOODEAATRI_021293, partial [Goodea atripinnis]
SIFLLRHPLAGKTCSGVAQMWTEEMETTYCLDISYEMQSRCKQFLVCSFILEDFQKFSIDVSLVSEHAQCISPASVVISNISTGSRTILHMNSFIIMADPLRPLQFGPPKCSLYVHVFKQTFMFPVFLSVSSWPTSYSVGLMCQKLLGRSKVKLHVHVAWSARNASEQVKMIQQVEMFNTKRPEYQRITISVEIEKTREQLYELFPYGDVVWVISNISE